MKTQISFIDWDRGYAWRFNDRTRSFFIFKLVFICIFWSLFGTLESCDHKKVTLPKGNQARTEKELEITARALEHFFIDIGRYPTESEGFSSLYSNEYIADTDRGSWNGPYLVNRGLFKNKKYYDWFGTPIRYTITNNLEKPIEIRSAGEDKTFGTMDDISRIPRSIR